MSAIKLKEPWCVNTGGLTYKEVEELQNLFVDSTNKDHPWQPNMYVGINAFGDSYCEYDISSFDYYGLAENVRVYSKKEILEIAQSEKIK